MKKIKRTLALFLLITLITMMLPTTAFAAYDFEITSISPSPSTIATGGGSVNISYTIKNTGTSTITSIESYFWLPSGTKMKTHSTSIAVGASKTFTDTISFSSSDVNQNIELTVWNTAPLLSRSKTFKVTGEDNVVEVDDNIILSGDVIEPEQDIYYVGETVSITDTMRNSASVNVTSLKMEYYLRRSTGDTAGDTVNIGTLTPNEKKSNTLEYTFTDQDLDGLRIGSSVTYYVSGKGPYTEYNIAHDFIVQPSPTPTASPTPSDTPTATPTSAPTDTPETTQEQVEIIVNQEDNIDADEQQNNSSTGSILNDRGVVIAIIVMAGVIIALILVVIIILITKK